jgi:transposase InsO family protein
MPWKETCPVKERVVFVDAYESGEWSMAELCRQFGVSRKTGYKWLWRFEGGGVEALADASRARHRHPNAMASGIEAALLAARQAHPRWGPRKVKARLEARQPGVAWPAASTIGDLFARAGLVVARRRRRRAPPRSEPLAPCHGPNDVWTGDFKGWFRTDDGRRCDPLTVKDSFSRYLLRLKAVAGTDTEHVWPVLEGAFFEFGLPSVFRSDGGPPFAGTGVGGLSRLAVKLIKAGVRPERIDPGRPEQQGRHERFHLTLKQETASPPAATLAAQRRRFTRFQKHYNEERPHEALGQTPPARHYRFSPRPFSGRLRSPEYADDRSVRRVRHSGEIKWRGERIFVSQALVGEPVALTETEGGLWLVAYGPLALGLIDHGNRLLVPNRRRRASKEACGFDGHRSRDAHNSTGPTTAST